MTPDPFHEARVLLGMFAIYVVCFAACGVLGSIVLLGCVP